jgi:glycosyltransferase involved in cell wall biosynthesis
MTDPRQADSNASLPLLSVAMPAYNEQACIEAVVLDHLRVLQSLCAAGEWELLCLDDGSDDGTLAILQALAAEHPGVRVERHERNLGLFESMTDAARLARGRYVYLTASDGQWPADNLARLLSALRQENADVAVAVRDNRASIYTAWRRVVSFFFRLLPRVLFGVDTLDPGSVKLAAREIFAYDLVSRSPFAEAERLIVARARGLKVVAVPALFSHRAGGRASGARWCNITSSLRDVVRCLRRYGLRCRRLRLAARP